MRMWFNDRGGVVMALLVAAAALGAATVAQASRPDVAPDKTLSPYFVVKGGAAGEEAMPLEGTRAEVSISGVIAKVRVTQVYRNRGKTPLEALYVFPGSTRAAVFGMEMVIGDRTVRAKIQEKEQARKMYEAAKKAGKSASLLEQHRPNVFQMNVANIMPGDRIEVRLDYTELLVPTDGEYEFVYPAVVGPRYSEKTEKTAGQSDKFAKQGYQRKGEKPGYDWDVRVNLDAGVPIASLSSPSHKLDQRVDGHRAMATLADGVKGGDSDFILKYGLRGDAVQTGMMLFPGKKNADEKFFLMMMQPPKAVDDVAMPAREYVFILDVSGSMRGHPLNIAKGVMNRLISGMRAEDRFNIMTFSGGARVLSPKSLSATPENLQRARGMMESLRGGGGTRLLPALKQALAMPAPETMSRTFVVVTDGYVTVEAEAFELIRENLGQANLFAFGIGSSVNRHLIEGMARVGQGEPFVVTRHVDASEAAAKFGKYIASPALTNIKVAFKGFRAYDVEPMSVPDLFAERPVLVYGKYKGRAKGKVVVTGTSGRGAFERTLNVAETKPSADNGALRYLWARARIAALSDLHKLSRDDKRKKEVTRLGLKYNLMTAYTSFIAVDDAVRNKNGKSRTQQQPLPLPKGVDESAIGGLTGGSMGMGGVGISGMGSGGGGLGSSGGYGGRGMRTKSAPKMKLGRAKPTAAPPKFRMRLGPVKVEGDLEQKVVVGMIRRRLRAMRMCGRTGEGKVQLRVVVGSDGRVTGVTVLSSTLDEATKHCIIRQMKRVRFPKKGGVAVVSLALTR